MFDYDYDYGDYDDVGDNDDDHWSQYKFHLTTLRWRSSQSSFNEPAADEEDDDEDDEGGLLRECLKMLTVVMMRMIKESASSAPGRLKPKMAPFWDTMEPTV